MRHICISLSLEFISLKLFDLLLALHRLQYGYFELARLCEFVEFLSINVSKVKKNTHILCFDYFPVLHIKFK